MPEIRLSGDDYWYFTSKVLGYMSVDATGVINTLGDYVIRIKGGETSEEDKDAANRLIDQYEGRDA
jgi:hypothetical protein